MKCRGVKSYALSHRRDQYTPINRGFRGGSSGFCTGDGGFGGKAVMNYELRMGNYEWWNGEIKKARPCGCMAGLGDGFGY